MLMPVLIYPRSCYSVNLKKKFSSFVFLWVARAPSLRFTYQVYIFLGGSSRVPVLLSSKTVSPPLRALAKDMTLNLLFVTVTESSLLPLYLLLSQLSPDSYVSFGSKFFLMHACRPVAHIVPGTVLGAGAAELNETGPALLHSASQWSRRAPRGPLTWSEGLPEPCPSRDLASVAAAEGHLGPALVSPS